MKTSDFDPCDDEAINFFKSLCFELKPIVSGAKGSFEGTKILQKTTRAILLFLKTKNFRVPLRYKLFLLKTEWELFSNGLYFTFSIFLFESVFMPTFLVVSRHPPENCPMNNEDEETDAGVAEITFSQYV